ncbi:MAG TPA: hypothetical protein VFT71_02875 [Candidatus Nitrosocosmicus sp.]|nr:hypothetical protein [Candidatus Nitrosocosmicus sp.]
MPKSKPTSFDPFNNGIQSLVVQLFTFCTSNPNKEIWTIDEIYNERYPNSTHDRVKTMEILKKNLKWLESKQAIIYQSSSSIRLLKFRLSSLIDEIYLSN